MVYEKPQLSLWEKASLIALIARTLGNGLFTSITGPFRGSSGSPKYTNHVKIAMLRSFLRGIQTRHIQAITPTLDEVYLAYAKKQGFQPKDIALSNGTKGFWIGDPAADRVIIWFHGGGYSLPPDPAHLTFAVALSKARDPHIAVLMLAYTLVPHATYPGQLREAVECLRHIVTESKKKPQSVSIGGDSAGANLAIGVLSHLLHPHPEIEPLNLDGKLGSAILLAPWASFRTDWQSNTYNAYKDIVSIGAGDKWSQAFLGGRKRDGYNEPLAAEEGWWKGLDGVVRDIMIAAGSDEILVDCIRELSKRFNAVHSSVTTVIADGEWHDMPTLELLGAGTGEQDAAIKSFVRSRL